MSIRAGRTGDRGALTGVEFDIVDDRTERNIAQKERIAHFRSSACAAHHGLAHLETVRCDDVAFLTVGIYQECDTCSTIGVVLDRFHSSRHSVLGTFEIHETVHLLVTAADVTYGHLTAVVTSARAFLGAEQRFLRRALRDFVERADYLVSRTCGYRFEFSYCHLR